jgi:hypothetical protein
MTSAERLLRILLDEADADPHAMKGVRPASRPRQGKVFKDAWEAAASVPRSGWRDWREAGVQFSQFHQDRTPFALPFRPDSYVWAGPFTLKMPGGPSERREDFRLGHYRRGVRKYASMLAQGLKLPPVALLYHEAWGWTMQDGNHRFEALVKAGATTYDAFLGTPKQKQAFDSF